MSKRIDTEGSGGGRLRRRRALTSCPAAQACLAGEFVSDNLRLVITYQEPWTALGDRTRRTIFERIAARPQAVGELASDLPVSRPAVSQHLKVLKDAGLVIDQRAGNRRIYRLNPEGVGALRADIERFWSDALAAYKRVVEQATEET